ncbi:TadE/TadG family type IV pilus assembly protein [Candidatus Liberibacter africanus]|uniref:TadE-like domain-containing protein n=1 Tax=Candidatus Liberibacter africanus PTSAPSY TaxID=1277257 RepID=A0A0G3I371_LIBAF|nr:TadE/TadG family type IV pilus assembly protein [Candidatus Liberibacter africanus]AKK20334.1 hypothetical protein G293_03530 [Candidatus Liberibacter africanus PTSAPSY]
MRRIENYILRFLSRKNGVAAIEMAFIFPVLLLIYFSVFEITMLYSLSKRLTRVASNIGDMIAQESSIDKSYLEDFEKLLTSTMYPYIFNDCSIMITGYWVDSDKKVTKKWSWSSPNIGITVKEDVPNSIKDYSSFVVRTEVTMKYQTFLMSRIFPNSLNGIIPLDKVFYYRQRLGGEVICRDCQT